MALPMKEVDFIKYAKKSGIIIKKGKNYMPEHKQAPRIFQGVFVINHSKSACYVADLSGYLIVFVDEESAKAE